MRKLATEFRKNGFDFKQLRRFGDVALFEKSKPTHHAPTYEVVKVQSHDGYEMAGVKIDPAETMPSSETWGRLGWTCTDLECAEQKYAELLPS